MSVFVSGFYDVPDELVGPTHTSTPSVHYPAILVFRTDVLAPDVIQKSKKESPTWYMVDVEFKSRAQHFVPLSVLKSVAAGEYTPECLTPEDVDAVKGRFACVLSEFMT